ncbi:MAG: aldose epimerase [Cyanothece sp. SIO1E1]|nr:aldose epimerase [Cyanothece sp. SIO1E1]
MFSIAAKQDQYRTYILTDQTAQSKIEVVPERGAIITKWQVEDQQILYLNAERFANPELSIRGGIPILFPICGNLPNNIYNHKGQDYTLKQHGFARDLPWQVTDQITQGEASLTLVLESNEQTRGVYPFDFQLAFTYRLQGKTLELRQRHTNRSDISLPFSTGLHPYFWVADKTQLEFQIPATQYQDQQTRAVHSFSGAFDWEQDEIDVAFGELSSQSAVVRDRQRHLQLTIDYDDTYSTLVFWTIQGKDYYCLEPWSAPRNAINTGESLTQLEPGATLETVVRITVEF